jgi:hypothetical protein
MFGRWLVGSALLLAACKDAPMTVEAEGDPAGFLGVGGTGANDVWVVGADKGFGPTVLHFDGGEWSRVESGFRGDLWWVHPLEGGPVLFGGANGMVVKYDGSEFENLRTPGPGRRTVFGVWASAESDIWAVGAHAGRSGFVWHHDGVEWTELLLPLDIPRRADGELPALLKVWGDGAGTVYIVGSEGTLLRSVDGGPLEVVETGTTARLFTIAGNGDTVFVVGESGGAGIILQLADGAVTDVTPPGAQPLQGVSVSEDGRAFAAGLGGQLLTYRKGEWTIDEEPPVIEAASLHAAWIDPDGNRYAVGGNVLTSALDGGVLLSNVEDLPGIPAAPTPETPSTTCPATAIDLAPGQSVAQGWNEQLLNAIRRDTPRPGVHARNLFHSSVAMWDAWAVYDDVGVGYLVDETHTADDVEAARHEAISYAVHEVLTHRYAPANGGATSVDCFNAYLQFLGYDPTFDESAGDSPAEIGNRIGKAIVAHYADDGANEAGNYADPDNWTSPNPPVTVDNAGYTPVDPSVWAPLNLAVAVTQNGIVAEAGVQKYIGAQWRDVEPFALTRLSPELPYFSDEGPLFDDADMNDWLVEVIRETAWLDPTDGVMKDISPGVFGNNPLGTNAGTGHPVNPATGQPYPANVVPRGDFGRVLAEFWADGPKSETPPGHWNTLANDITHHPEFERLLMGTDEVDALEWDVKVYLALNGAVHDAAIAAWELKREYLGARPIALIRYKATLGQSSDPAGPSYHEDGLPLIPGLIEVITEESSAPGERHQYLAHFVGELAVFTWRGEPGDHVNEVGGHAWERAEEWMPYQRRTFVTPAFPGFTSGHSTFSRSAATVLDLATGSPYFPGGLGEFVAPRNAYLVFEDGPSVDVRLQWATYYDAADQAGQSRLWGGIHIWPDDTFGRQTGAEVGAGAFDKAVTYWDGTAASSR